MPYIIMTEGDNSQSGMRHQMREEMRNNRHYNSDGYRRYNGGGRTYEDGYRDGYRHGYDDAEDDTDPYDSESRRRPRDSRGRYM